MWTLGATRAARACSAWARPISPPSAVTAALLDMFCGLNGCTRNPRLANARARPATTSDLPTSEPVPCTISARAAIVSSEIATGWLKLDPGLRLHAGGEVMFDESHLGDEIGGFYKRRFRISTGDDDVQAVAPAGERGDHRFEVEIIVAQGDIELVENDEAERWIVHQLDRLVPGTLGRGHVARQILRLPGEAFAHGVP